jgi:membrane associated rhomboid family serine protease
MFILLPGSIGMPWVYLTYPFVNDLAGGFGVIGMLFLAFWLYWVGGALERDLGALRFGILWLVAGLLEAACVAIAGSLIGVPWIAQGALLPVGVLTVVWGVRNRTASVMLMMILPLNGFWMAWLMVAIILVEYGRQSLFLGAAACLPLALAWAYADNKIPGLTYGKPVNVYKPSKAQRQGFLNTRRD